MAQNHAVDSNIAPFPNTSGIAFARANALSKFLAQGLPSKHSEAWKYAAPKLGGLMDYANKASVPAEVEGNPLFSGNTALQPYFTISENPLVNANTAFAAEGQLIDIPANELRDIPILIATENGGHRKYVVRLGKNAKASLFFTYTGNGAYWNNSVLHAELAEGATLSVYRLQNESLQAFHTSHTEVKIAAGAEFNDFLLGVGGKVARHTAHVDLQGKGAHATLNGAYLAKGEQYMDHYLPMIHSAPETYSKQLYKGVLDGAAEATFYGHVTVPKDSQKIEARQLNQNILLSDGAHVNTRPELTIYADDVKCSHGATVGELDEEALYYLRARGLPEQEAHSLLIYGFIQELLDGIKIASVRDAMAEVVHGWLGQE
jgi:Fe-S cluster assembly protein SufD